MKRVIDSTILVDMLFDYAVRNLSKENNKIPIKEVLDMIEVIPSINAEPVVNANWNISYEEAGAFETTRTYYYGRCSNCGRRIDIACLNGLHNKNDFSLVKKKALDDFPYCHCGAKIDEVSFVLQ